MHDEDNRLSLFHRDESKLMTWYAHSEQRFFDEENKTNMERCFLALQTTVAEVYNVYDTKYVIPETVFNAW